jgi:CDP-glucose 4,6-dehydratase
VGFWPGALEDLDPIFGMRPPDSAGFARAYSGRRVLVTGHTGFKGAWLTFWLSELGAQVTGLALPPDAESSLFSALDLASRCRHLTGDIRNFGFVQEAVQASRPEFVFHLAAQSLVRRSYREPVSTIATNVLGTAHLLEAVRRLGAPCAVVVVTSDKCYENREHAAGYSEEDPLGGHDIYSTSKAAAELVAAGYRRSFFPVTALAVHGVAVATARAGNVLGGGDWSDDRLIPDAVRALRSGEPLRVRNPDSRRPWQHVLDPLAGYLLLAKRLGDPSEPERASLCGAWNFGPEESGARSVAELAEAFLRTWGEGRWVADRNPNAPHEAGQLRLSSRKAREQLGWTPHWGFDETLRRTVEWYRAHAAGARAEELVELMRVQIRSHQEGARVG